MEWRKKLFTSALLKYVKIMKSVTSLLNGLLTLENILCRVTSLFFSHVGYRESLSSSAQLLDHRLAHCLNDVGRTQYSCDL
jgi:hypothetical protein